MLFFNSHRAWALKTHGYLVIDLSGGRRDLQIDHPMSTLRLIIKTEVLKVKEEVSTGLACPTLAVHSSVTTVMKIMALMSTLRMEEILLSVTLTHDCGRECVKIRFY